ncbi:hypothetical protein [Dysgonomonas sp.]|jgi:hypothetical protein|nr:hypothetical protein [Prevotella sp.]
MDEKDKIIASLRTQLQEALSTNRVLEQEMALLEYKINITSKATQPLS